MKYRWMGFAGLALVFVTVLAAGALESDNPTNRVHQHLTARQPDEGCDCDGSQLCTHLPLVIIDTGGVEVPGEPVGEDGSILGQNAQEYEYSQVTLAEDGSKTVECQVSVVDGDESNHHPDDEPTLETTARIRIRGNTSRLHDKKGYLLVTTEEDGLTNKDVSMLGMDAHHEWALHGPYLDKTMIRNYMWYNIAGEIMDYAANVRFCEVILNGEYIGLYVMTETITNGDGCRLDMTLPEDDDQAVVSYVVRLDRGSSNPLKNIETFTQYSLRTSNVIDIVYPGTGNLTEERIQYIEQDVSDFEKALYSYDYDTEPYAWWDYCDMDSMADYFIINEFTVNYDVGSRSTYLYKDVRGKYQMVIWDFNAACNNFHDSQFLPQRFQMQYITWFYMLTKDENFVDLVVQRYRQHRETFLSDEYLMNYIDETIAYLGDAVERNFQVWGYSFEDYRPLSPDSRNPDNYEEAVESLKEAILERAAWMDYNIESLYQYCHESKVKKFNH